jgi:hypothetical protein
MQKHGCYYLLIIEQPCISFAHKVRSTNLLNVLHHHTFDLCNLRFNLCNLVHLLRMLSTIIHMLLQPWTA